MADELLVAECMAADTQVAVTGYRGFLGRSFLAGRQWKARPLQACSPRAVIHLAAKVEDTLQGFLANLTLDAEIAAFCAARQATLIYASSNNVYPQAEHCGESDEVRHGDYYSLSKIAGEKLITSGALGKFDFVVLRIADVFGLGQRHGNLFKAMAANIAARAPLKLYGQGAKTRSYIYVKDMVGILDFAVVNFRKFNGGVCNVCYEEPATVKDLVERIASLAGLPIERVDSPDAKDIRTMRNGKLLEAGYRFAFTLDTALADYVRDVKTTGE